MKYLLKIIFFSVMLIPFMIWEFLVSVWVFDTTKVKELWDAYSDGVELNYRRAFPRRSRRPSRF
jgi:hypothetical protein